MSFAPIAALTVAGVRCRVLRPQHVPVPKGRRPNGGDAEERSRMLLTSSPSRSRPDSASTLRCRRWHATLRDPLSNEFARVLQEMQIGLGRQNALRALGDRSPLPELRSFASAMVQADSFGIPVAQVLRVQSSEIRLKRRQRAEEQAQKIPVKILLPLMTLHPALPVHRRHRTRGHQRCRNVQPKRYVGEPVRARGGCQPRILARRDPGASARSWTTGGRSGHTGRHGNCRALLRTCRSPRVCPSTGSRQSRPAWPASSSPRLCRTR